MDAADQPLLLGPVDAADQPLLLGSVDAADRSAPAARPCGCC